MGIIHFQINTYQPQLFQEKTFGTVSAGIKLAAMITGFGTEWKVIIRFMKSRNPLPANLLQKNIKRVFMNVRAEKYSDFIDLFRNEKPLSFVMNEDIPESAKIYAGSEPVGEEES